MLKYFVKDILLFIVVIGFLIFFWICDKGCVGGNKSENFYFKGYKRK